MLYAAQGIPEWWNECRPLMGLSTPNYERAYLERFIDGDTQLRPDFFVRVDSRHVAVIEVELADEAQQQTADYRKRYGEVFVIVGKGAGPSLETIGRKTLEVAARIEPTNWPGAVVLRHLAEMIERHAREAKPRPAVHNLPERLVQQVWFTRALGPLLDLMRAGPSGKPLAINRPTSPGSISLRLVRGPSVACRSSFALLTQSRTGPFLVPTPDEVRRVFGRRLAALPAAWEKLVTTIHPRWHLHAQGTDRIALAPAILELHADDFESFYASGRTGCKGLACSCCPRAERSLVEGFLQPGIALRIGYGGCLAFRGGALLLVGR